MYRAHSKDINRNKSFHPLTFGNLRRVEQLKENAELDKEKAAERQKELQRDQEERRYDELILANSADSVSGELARFRQTRSIFAAEYEADAKAATSAAAQDAAAAPSSAAPQQATVKQEVLLRTPAGGTLPANGFLAKFKKEAMGAVKSEPVVGQDAVTSASVNGSTGNSDATTGLATSGDVSQRKRGRDEVADDASRQPGAAPSAPATGFVTSAEAAQLRKELNLAQKQRHDPLMRVRQYQNQCVASAAVKQEHREQQQQQQGSGSRADKNGDEKEKLQSRIRELLALKKGRK